MVATFSVLAAVSGVAVALSLLFCCCPTKDFGNSPSDPQADQVDHQDHQNHSALAISQYELPAQISDYNNRNNTTPKYAIQSQKVFVVPHTGGGSCILDNITNIIELITGVTVNFECPGVVGVNDLRQVLRCCTKVVVLLTNPLLDVCPSCRGSATHKNKTGNLQPPIAPNMLEMLSREQTGFRRILLVHWGLREAKQLYSELLDLHWLPDCCCLLRFSTSSNSEEEGNPASAPVPYVTERSALVFRSVPSPRRPTPGRGSMFAGDDPPPSYSTLDVNAANSATESLSDPPGQPAATAAVCRCGRQAQATCRQQQRRHHSSDETDVKQQSRSTEMSRSRHRSEPPTALSPPDYHTMCPSSCATSWSAAHAAWSFPAGRHNATHPVPPVHRRPGLFDLSDPRDFKQFLERLTECPDINDGVANRFFDDLVEKMSSGQRVQPSCYASPGGSTVNVSTRPIRREALTDSELCLSSTCLKEVHRQDETT